MYNKHYQEYIMSWYIWSSLLIAQPYMILWEMPEALSGMYLNTGKYHVVLYYSGNFTWAGRYSSAELFKHNKATFPTMMHYNK